MTRKKRYAAALTAAVLVLLFWYFSYNAHKDMAMEDKVKAAVVNAVELAQYEADMPRIKMLGDARNMTHYAAKLHERPDLVKQQLLVSLTNSNVPPFKLVSFNINSSVYSSADTEVTIAYGGAFGIQRKQEIRVDQQRLIAFKHEVGPDAFPKPKAAK